MELPVSPQPCALQSFLQTHPPPENNPHDPYLHHLALQIAHNLRYQHGWERVRIHHYSSSTGPVAHSVRVDAGKRTWLPRSILSGLPPRRLYVHPDEQIAVLREHKKRQDAAAVGEGEAEGVDLVKREREWVLPSHLREKWSLRRFGEVFDCISIVPGDGEAEELFEQEEDEDGGIGKDEGAVEEVNEWRMKMPKRLLLATLDDDSTVVYYIVHDGIVKPRQN